MFTQESFSESELQRREPEWVSLIMFGGPNCVSNNMQKMQSSLKDVLQHRSQIRQLNWGSGFGVFAEADDKQKPHASFCSHMLWTPHPSVSYLGPRKSTVPGVLQSWPSVPALTLASSEVQISHRVRITIACLVGTVVRLL